MLYLLHPHLLSGCSLLATPDATDDVPVLVCFDVHVVHNYDT